MIRYFLVLAVTGARCSPPISCSGFSPPATAHGAGAIARGIHVLFSLATVVALLGVHSIVYTYFVATGKWAKEVVTVYQLARLVHDPGDQEQAAGVSVHHVEHDGDRRGRLAGRRRRYPRPGLFALAPGLRGLGPGVQSRFVRGGIRRDRGSGPAL